MTYIGCRSIYHTIRYSCFYIDLIIDNITRRVLYIIREEYETAAQEPPPELASATPTPGMSSNMIGGDSGFSFVKQIIKQQTLSYTNLP